MKHELLEIICKLFVDYLKLFVFFNDYLDICGLLVEKKLDFSSRLVENI